MDKKYFLLKNLDQEKSVGLKLDLNSFLTL